MTKITKTFKKLSATVLCSTLLCGAYINTANAGLIQADYVKNSGDNGAVYDNSTKLTWLDLDKTLGLNESDALTSFTGYRFATKIEFDTIFESFFQGLSVDVSTDNTDKAIEWINLFGETKYTKNTTKTKVNVNESSMGMILNDASLFSLGAKYTHSTTIANQEIVETGTLYKTTLVDLKGSAVADYTTKARGWYLVKDFVADNDGGAVKVPEPTSLALFALALFGFGARRFSK